METEEKTVDVVKRTWHTPELRKNAVRHGTLSGPGFGDDGDDESFASVIT